jgi:hypothetical protein
MNARTLLHWGAIAGPFYLALGVGQGLLREGFSFERHPLSVLANGSYGWIQTANFVLSGLMVLAAAAGFRRVLAPKPGAWTWFLGAYGAGMILAAIFPADPVDGFPPGTAEGFPTRITTTGVIHFIAGALTFTSIGISGLCAAWALRRRAASLAWLSLFSGLSVFGGFFGGIALPIVVVGWLWLLVLSLRLKPDAASAVRRGSTATTSSSS